MGKKNIIVIFLIILTGVFLFKKYGYVFSSHPAMVVSVSSDGKYVISSHLNKIVILWDLTKHKKHIISTNANIYSAYFIKNSHNFMWQDLNDNVYVQSVDNKKLLKFHNFPTYGQVMTSDLKTYIASDQDWSLYSGYGANQKLFKKGADGFLGYGKLLNLTLSNDEKLLLTSGAGSYRDKARLISGPNAIEENFDDIAKFSFLDGVVLWDIINNQPLQKFPGNNVKTFATLSPDDKYVIGGDEDLSAFLWNAQTGKQVLELDDLYWGRRRAPNDHDVKNWNRSHLIKIPDDFIEKNGMHSNYAILAFKFIDLNGHYLRFTTDVPYAVLHSVTDPAPLKYFPLGKDPFPSVSNYSRDQSIDTAPAANILVTGQDKGSGIIVYHFDPQKLTLEKVWVAKG